ncbi:hypothetical protein FOA43_002569 [Brettanomyces nanus]|uniref:Indolepyruvate decarboxylase n=1 Tax=Eeniella nana TaxID=13502 RepID=A0A875S653_EENNA|nr:uncharacterized protein FOA43_002569 [Brettanomyces nanus]QPG75219.1 hypothetical protein FOA43_002569 [Brettanomyces nanus]
MAPNSVKIPLGDYVFKRIVSLGVHSVFGVPGDFNLSFLECLYDVPEIHWYGTCNELNGAYAADGYSRKIGNKFGVLATTMGVGELSAMNGICGSFAEYVPILHIVGTTPISAKKNGLANHHLITSMCPLQKNDHYVYQKMAATVSCNVTSIEDLREAPSQIDALIRDILTEKKPGYLYIPCDLATAPVDATNLTTIPGASFYETQPRGSAHVINEIADLALEKIYKATKPCVLGDGLVDRFGMTNQLRQFVERTKLPNCSNPMGKSLLDEQNDYYVGDFIGNESAKQVAAYVRSCDLLLHFGNFDNEVNSGHFSIHNGFEDKEDNGKSLIIFNHRYIRIDSQVFDGYSIEDILPAMLAKLDISKVPNVEKPNVNASIERVPSSTPISETDVLEEIQHLLQPGDTLVVETGSILYGIPDIKLPSNCKLISQPFYLSIGMGLPCSFGASVAKKELNEQGRLILLEGDGAAQMTIQELANYNRPGLSPLIILLNNDGYTVERAIKGPTREYNDIRPNWKWGQIFDTFGLKNYRCKKVIQLEDMHNTLEEFGRDNSCARMVEVVLGKLDAPWRVNKMLDGYK